jgi:hypothetical protein
MILISMAGVHAADLPFVFTSLGGCWLR